MFQLLKNREDLQNRDTMSDKEEEKVKSQYFLGFTICKERKAKRQILCKTECY